MSINPYPWTDGNAEATLPTAACLTVARSSCYGKESQCAGGPSDEAPMHVVVDGQALTPAAQGIPHMQNSALVIP